MRPTSATGELEVEIVMNTTGCVNVPTTFLARNASFMTTQHAMPTERFQAQEHAHAVMVLMELHATGVLRSTTVTRLAVFA